MTLSTILSLLITVLVCGILYYRMIKREIPKPIGWIQALVPIALGMATMEISGFIGVKLPNIENGIIADNIGGVGGVYIDSNCNGNIFQIPIDMRIKHYLLRKDTVSGSLWIVSENDRDTCLETQFMERVYHPEDAYFLHVDYYNSDNKK